MRLSFLPKTRLGKWSSVLIIYFILAYFMLRFFISFGERGGESFFSNIKLAFSGLISAICAIAAFFIGLVSIIKQKERSIIVFIAVSLGFLILLFALAEIIFPH